MTNTPENEKRGMLLNVPYTEKDQAKRLGARWDPDIKRWFVPHGLDTGPFLKWLPNEQARPAHKGL